MEKEFREIVLKGHRDKRFRGDRHRMQTDFKLKESAIDFLWIANGDGFVSVEIFLDAKGNKIGFIHCLGVYKESRGKGISNDLMRDIEIKALEKHKDMYEMRSVCNQVSAKSHIKNGWEITHPGRKMKNSDELCMIRLKKSYNS